MTERVSNEQLDDWAQGLYGFSNPGRDLALDLLDARDYSEKRRESLAKALRERDEARKALVWFGEHVVRVEKPVPRFVEAAIAAARAAAQEERR